jgi:hypothetical protein
MNEEEILDLLHRCLSHFSDGRTDKFYPSNHQIDRFAALLKERTAQLGEPAPCGEE